MDKDTQAKLSKKLFDAKVRLLTNNGFYGVLLMGMKIALVNELDDKPVGVASTDDAIYFSPIQLEKFTDKELDLIIMHELMHIVLKHTHRARDFDFDLFNNACDIVVNSNILMDEKGNVHEASINGHDLEHVLPNGEEGHLYSAEEAYSVLYAYGRAVNPMFGEKKKDSSSSQKSGGSDDEDNKGNDDEEKENDYENVPYSFDSHDGWEEKTGSLEDIFKNDLIDKRILEAYEAAKRKSCGSIPGEVERIVKNLKDPQIDWRIYLNNFIQEDIVDYSFLPPDKRYQDGDFFLPDFNEKDESVKNILFMIDTSGSMSIEDITDCFTEIKGALDQFNGKLEGKVGFFDAEIHSVNPIDSNTNILDLIPQGGGGTAYEPIFDYVRSLPPDERPVSIIILTDGYVSWYPNEEDSLGIPLLYIINNEDMTPPYGKIARIKHTDDDIFNLN